MKSYLLLLLLIPVVNISFAQSNFVGIVKYKLHVPGSLDAKADSMAVVFDSSRFLIILYLPDSQGVTKRLFIDDLADKKSYKVDPQAHTFEIDSLKTAVGYAFKNSYSLGAVNRDLCLRYSADLTEADRSFVFAAECLASIDYRNSFVKDYSFLGVQPLIVDNRLVMEFVVNRSNGTKPTITVSDIRRLENVDSYFDLWGYRQINLPIPVQSPPPPAINSPKR